MRAGYAVAHTADIALSAATAKTVLNIIAAANAMVVLTELSVSFDGTSATAEPVTVELCLSTQATAGTSTARTPTQVRGATRTVQASAAENYSAEPTALTVVKTWLIHPQAGQTIQLPLGREVEQTNAKGIALRITAPAAVNCRAHAEFEEA